MAADNQFFTLIHELRPSKVPKLPLLLLCRRLTTFWQLKGYHVILWTTPIFVMKRRDEDFVLFIAFLSTRFVLDLPVTEGHHCW